MTGKLPTVIRPSASEIKNSKLDERNVEIAVRSLHQDGLVVVEDVIPHEHINQLNTKMTEDALALQARGTDGPYNYNLGNLQQDPPPWAEYFYPSIFANKIGTQITSSVLGPRPKWTFCSANSAMPPLSGSSQQPQRQPVHSDADFAHPSHPFALVVNIPLVDMTPENGSTELWLGTHTTHGRDTQEGAHGDRASGRIRQQVMDQWKADAQNPFRGGECQPPVKKGSIVIRDLRLWHAGMPNLSSTGQVRVMLAMIHFASWYRNPMRLEFAEDIRPVLEELDARGELGLEVPVDWVSVDKARKGYLDRGFGNSYDFDQAAR
ncbi:uncharacterized protein B0I36DRAFT_372324 [Microdochium trichocladiopsis]|uniref:Phytanoyl-CoA dioxygenase n=1 Tax=Microdochium trichocladiopsis TaxID=1682393 RepID=A0A9P9BYK5_9PEZI|nr:uncharacterized protein B0I36DRAFT_372324 [Microdochium trichocladiopsis]KAH7038143.1 hypothetical protein B0I36DRAFT_372324 [Microdochium trichocladiopsis]